MDLIAPTLEMRCPGVGWPGGDDWGCAHTTTLAIRQSERQTPNFLILFIACPLLVFATLAEIALHADGPAASTLAIGGMLLDIISKDRDIHH